MKKYLSSILFIFLATASTAQLYVGSGALVSIDGTITLHNLDFIRSPGADPAIVFAPGSNVLFTGDADNTVSGYISFLNLEIAKEGNHKISLLNNDEELRGNMRFTSGFFDLNGNSLVLTGNGTLLNENEDSRIIGPAGGSVYTTLFLNQPTNVNPGNIGCTVSSNKDLGQLSINRGYKLSYGFPEHAVHRYYSFSFSDPAKNTGLDATLKFDYFDSEKENLDEKELVPWKSDAITHVWEEQGPKENITRNSTENWVQLTGIDNMQIWSLAEQLSPVPLTLLNMQVTCKENSTIISWETASESNTDYFEIQRSVNGADWAKLALLEAAGNSNSVQKYSYSDARFSQTEKVFYRIASVDKDQQVYYSIVKPSSCAIQLSATVWPNPVDRFVNMRIISQQSCKVIVKLVDTKGAVLREWQQSLTTGGNTFILDLQGIAAGIYHIMVFGKNTQLKLSEKILKQ